MKIKKEHFQALKNEIDNILLVNHNAVEMYETGKFPRSEKVKDLQVRFCFDLYGIVLRRKVINAGELYEYLDDNHIYTALKAICPKVTKKY